MENRSILRAWGLAGAPPGPGPPSSIQAKTFGFRVVPLTRNKRSPRGASARGERQRAGVLAPAPSVAFLRAGPKGPGVPPATRTHPFGFEGGGWDFRVRVAGLWFRVWGSELKNQISGNQKLLDLGLTQAEATALTGYKPPEE